MLPYDLLLEISNFNKLYENKGLFFVNKYFFEIYKKKYLKNVIFIQKIYRKYKIPNDFLDSNMVYYNYQQYKKWERIFNNNNYIKIYRYIMLLSKLEYLRNYPEMLIKKSCSRHSSRYLIIKDWIENNLTENKLDRKKSDILNFFIKNRITLHEILMTGV